MPAWLRQKRGWWKNAWHSKSELCWKHYSPAILKIVWSHRGHGVAQLQDSRSL